MADGRQIGVNAAGSFTNDLPGEIDFYPFPKGDNEGIEWWVFLPDSSFTVDLFGTGEGVFNIILADKDSYRGFLSQPIGIGEQATFSYDASNNIATALNMPDGSSVLPKTITPEELDSLTESPSSSISTDDEVGVTEEPVLEDALATPFAEIELDEFVPEDAIPGSPESEDKNYSSLFIFGLIMCCSLIFLSAVAAGVFYMQYWSKR